ncbi:type VI secretion system baseplate subunit TssG [Azospirillum sp. A1-3]|uniref:type VI secretion system baseplate subunit TssG n=1 Tax=Azospirillum sp. A1-3 TaxID=185874 RepID=UPI0020774DB5|nr:type VI secretion system baseplate subunit TssG [Azospirillum sp. A1-3]MCM8738874.1 type VI secretion system baseplate subunit TssG [Azospirillum sp. A1-3]
MASADRPPQSVVSLLAAVAAEPHRFGLFHALRLLECANRDRPRLGRPETRVVDEPVRLGQEPSLDFAPSTLARIKHDEGALRSWLLVYGFGVFGPNGPLPLHLTEHVLERRRFHGDDTVARFADMFHHRLISLFYRAWANAEPTVSHDRPDADLFGTYIASLIGFGMPSLRDRDALPDAVRLHFAGRLTPQSRNPEGLQAMISAYFGMTAAVQEFVCAWMALPADIRWRLGDPRLGRLGDGMPVGSRVRDAQHRFRIQLGPMGMADYQRMLPGGRSLERLVAMVRGYVGDEFAWDVQLVLTARAVPPLRLDGSNRLGWTSWLNRSPVVPDADDLVLAPVAPRAAASG